MDDFITIARITKAHGVRGEVSAQILTDFPERFRSVDRVRLLCDREVRWSRIESFRLQGSRVVLRFPGLGDPEQASSLAGCEVQIPAEEAVDLPRGVYFHFQLTGCEVRDPTRSLGRVVEVLDMAGSTNLVVRTADGMDFMIPLVGQFVRHVDVAARSIRVDLPEGLVELGVSSSQEKPGRPGPGHQDQPCTSKS